MRTIALLSLLIAGCAQPTADYQANGADNAGVPLKEEGRPGAGSEIPPAPQAQVSGGAGACLVQDGAAVPANRLRGLGTEPFWGADVEGRCVTYSTPENPGGTRVWTRFSGTTETGSWVGALGGKPFVMKTRRDPGCSDGMSDNRYPLALSLTVGGEERRGCARPR